MMRLMQVFFAIIAVFVLQVALSLYAFKKSARSSNGELQLANI
jgi:hypothetical protein